MPDDSVFLFLSKKCLPLSILSNLLAKHALNLIFLFVNVFPTFAIVLFGLPQPYRESLNQTGAQS